VNKLLGILVLGLACSIGFGTMSGCKKDDKPKDNKTEGKSGDKSITVAAAPETVTLKPGEKKDVTVTITRTKTDADATVKVSDLPEGVKATVAKEGKIAKDAKEATVTFEADAAAKDADKDAKITVSSDGIDVTKNVKVSVKKS